jgi:glutamate synthase domain-containing protein 1/glutamate synthase domain-containing protein 3
MKQREIAEKLIASRKPIVRAYDPPLSVHKAEAEGGCGVIGIACSEKIPARHMLQSLKQMRNRGNGKGGGIAAVGLIPEEFGVTQEVLDRDYLLAIAYIEPAVRPEVERDHVNPAFEVDHVHRVSSIENSKALEGLDIRPPEAYCYFVRLKPEVIEKFKQSNGLAKLSPQGIEDEIVYQNSYRLNRAFYAATGEKRAFVLSHARNMLVLKMVGYGDDVIRYYKLEDLHAHIWIGHHRYPTKGRVWHPGGAHPFVGLNEALVHNGDFANYASISEYLAQRNIQPLFLTDTEVSVLVFDLLHRTYSYPLESVIEALAPTTERDFTLLSPDKQRLYQALQATHIHGSPDGPWFFLIAQSKPTERVYRLIGITDTSMLRPQVFALQSTGPSAPSIGFAASEKQGIDAALQSLAQEDPRFWGRADRYWNARGGSHTDGGAFIFTVHPNGQSINGGQAELVCTDKFGQPININTSKPPHVATNGRLPKAVTTFPDAPTNELFAWIQEKILTWNYDDLLTFLPALERSAQQDCNRSRALETLTLLIDGRYPTGQLRRSSLLALIDQSLARIIESVRDLPTPAYAYMNAGSAPPSPKVEDQALVIDARGYAPEGERSLALEIVRLYQKGWRRFLLAHTQGHRFIANGLGPNAKNVRIDVYGSSGDYLASGIDGAEVYVHGNAQDQLAQIMKDGKLVVYGDVGQTFMYAAKGGQVFVLGNAAGRPLINAVGKPRVIINGTCLDYLAESFMAGDPLNGGGFVIVNGIIFDDDGQIIELDTPYPGGNLFSLASGGAIYIRDPHGKVSEDQLNGGEFAELSDQDWELIKPYLEENERLFGIPVKRLLEVAGKQHLPEQVYHKIRPRAVRALQAEEAWVRKHE